MIYGQFLEMGLRWKECLDLLRTRFKLGRHLNLPELPAYDLENEDTIPTLVALSLNKRIVVECPGM